MNAPCKAIFVYIFALSVSITMGQRCNGGVACVTLNDCTGLFNQLQRGATPQLTRLLRGLHCGFQGEQPMFVNTGISAVQSSAQLVQRSKHMKTKKQKPATQSPVVEPNIFDLLWGFPTMTPTTRPTLKLVKKKAARKPTVKPTIQSAVKPIQYKEAKPSHIVKPMQRPMIKPTSNQLLKSTVQTPVKPLKTETRKVCCPPEFQGQPYYSSTTNSNSWSGNVENPDANDGGGWNRARRPSTNSNRPSDWSGGSNSNSNGNSANTNSNSNSNNWNGDPTSLLPNKRVCGIQNNDRIVGGTRADLDEHPWMALLRYDKPVGWGFYCGGVLISSRYVLTAAHCVKGEDLPTNWRLAQVRLGEWNTSSVNDCVMDDCAAPVKDIPIEERIAHEGYDPQDSNQHNDIALLRLAQNVEFNDFVKPICLPLSKDMKNNGFDGYSMEVAGWGKTESRSESEVKLKVSVPVVSRSECASVFGRVNREIINKQLCAGGTAGKDSCRGDSGGALMGRLPNAVNWFALGVVSYGPSPCGTPGWPGVYTRVGAYVDWILSKIRP